MPTIRNIVFDIGNVMVRWSPLEIIRLTFGEQVDGASLAANIFQSSLWLDYNRGVYTQLQVRQQLQEQMNFSDDELNRLFYYLVNSQILIYGQVDLLKRLHQAGYQLYTLTDNVPEIVSFIKQRYDFWPYFHGEVVSADVGCLKPDPVIYQYLLNTYQLNPAESVFTDDLMANIQGCQNAGMHGIHFRSSTQLETDLRALGVQMD
ncbi:HAD family hydrolase [Celerinatantimonas yamalensis]|uniref:HAD family phosphatase n=1 Tax=Celerinatantimonas yamalensis TaxID=559956 RepID=A0ABW9G2B2_9GAMM